MRARSKKRLLHAVKKLKVEHHKRRKELEVFKKKYDKREVEHKKQVWSLNETIIAQEGFMRTGGAEKLENELAASKSREANLQMEVDDLKDQIEELKEQLEVGGQSGGWDPNVR
mmetsp:Transcript_25147/g.39754  ORF Transcript_25147/g.39754 Transcript_25147/m.39754 type:complete len:114 (+) Transcript_25147:368-709(+)